MKPTQQFKFWMCVMLLVSVTAVAAPGYRKYMSVMKRNTKLQQEYSFETFSADLLWGLMYLNDETKDALWERESWITETPVSESKLLPPSQVRGTQFIMGLYAPPKTEKFSMDKDTFWVMKLDDGRSEYLPIAIEQIPNDVLARRLIPFTHKWAHLYLVTYAGDFQPPFTIRMVGDSAKSEIKWKASGNPQK